MNSTDFDFEERDFQRELRAAWGAGRLGSAPCPKTDLLMAACSGVPFEGAAEVLRHVAVCPICEQLSRDLAEYEFPPATRSEDRRLRARWQNSETRSIPPWHRSWGILSLAAVFGVLVIAVLVVRHTPQPARSHPAGVASQKPAAGLTPPSALTLTKAAIKIPASVVLTFRGDAESAKTYLADLANALEPYRQDNYVEALRRLAILSPKYPDAAEPAYYEGVSQLFLNQNQSAIESFEAARRRGSDTLRDDISWYLALAFYRSGKAVDARQQTEALCQRAGEYKARACAAADELAPR